MKHESWEKILEVQLRTRISLPARDERFSANSVSRNSVGKVVCQLKMVTCVLQHRKG